MDKDIHLTGTDTPTGLGIARSSTDLYVYTSCCKEYVYRTKNGSKLEWKCSGCDHKLFGDLPTSGHATLGLWHGPSQHDIEQFIYRWTGWTTKDIEVKVG